MPELSLPQQAGVVALTSRIRADRDELTTLVHPQFLDLVRRVRELQDSDQRVPPA